MKLEQQTRAQQDMVLAEKLVSTVMNNEEQRVRDIYGGLCHQFPIFVRTSGLCQALAFSKDKATPRDSRKSDRNRAHELLLEHVATMLADSPDNVVDALGRVRSASMGDYMLYTRRVLQAWIYYKRFAVSILKVADSAAAQEDDHVA